MQASNASRRRWLRALAATPLLPMLSGLGGCGGGGSADQAGATAVSGGGQAVAAAATGSAGSAEAAPAARCWRQGFGGAPPRLDVATAIEGIRLWSQRAELAVIHEEIPWQPLLAGVDPLALAQADKLPLATLYRNLGLKLLFVAELNDGTARELESPQLRAMGRSLTEPAVQAAWRSWVMAVAQVLQPDWLCLAAETNLVRMAAPAALYAAVVATANAAAADLRAAALARRPVLLTSVQVEAAWGRLPGMDGRYLGIQTDRVDFAFTEVLGLSSYPFLAYDQPADLPDDHYSRLLAGSGLPQMVTECGWSSVPVAGRPGSPEAQAAYQTRHAQLLDAAGALGVVQLLYADLDLAALGADLAQNLPLFACIGLADAQFAPKPALAAWDALHARPLA